MNDASEEQSTSTTRYGVFDVLAVALLSLATVGTAWCSYQSASWGAVSSKSAARSVARGNDAMAFRVKGNQMFLLDVFLLSQYINARNTSNEPLAEIYGSRFRPETKQAIEAWMRTKPFENAEALPHPFVTNYYEPPLLAEADRLELESEHFWGKADGADQIARNYTMITVLLAAALFFGGTAPRLRTPRGRRATLVIGLIVLLAAIIMICGMPMFS